MNSLLPEILLSLIPSRLPSRVSSSVPTALLRTQYTAFPVDNHAITSSHWHASTLSPPPPSPRRPTNSFPTSLRLSSHVLPSLPPYRQRSRLVACTKPSSQVTQVASPNRPSSTLPPSLSPLAPLMSDVAHLSPHLH
ncbi:hypothetical protein C8F01DRAFT_1243982 [Mycena amicta]|nr:hypothetical protein C8F01DRAFT_1243982 [Mycena amicta]